MTVSLRTACHNRAVTDPIDVVEVCTQIDAAHDEDALVEATVPIASLVADSLRMGTSAARFAQVWSTVVRSTVAAAARIGMESSGGSWTWLVSGSTARDDALPGSDVESILAVDDSGVDLRNAMDRAAHVHEILDRCGFRGDDKGAVASRKRFCRTRTQWLSGIAGWTEDPVADRGVVMAGLLADSRSVAGEPVDLRGPLGDAMRLRTRSLRLMLDDSLADRGAIPSRLRVFATRDDVIDLKSAAVQPIVQIARWAALSVGSSALPTAIRLDNASGSTYLSADDAEVLAECHSIVTEIRWRHRASRWLESRSAGDGFALSALSPQDRALIRHVGREVSGIKRKLAYLSSTSSFTS